MDQKQYNSLLAKRMKMDKFFSMYLDTYGDKLDTTDTCDKYWILYKKKLKEYGELQEKIRYATHVLGKKHV